MLDFDYNDCLYLMTSVTLFSSCFSVLTHRSDRKISHDQNLIKLLIKIHHYASMKALNVLKIDWNRLELALGQACRLFLCLAPLENADRRDMLSTVPWDFC